MLCKGIGGVNALKRVSKKQETENIFCLLALPLSVRAVSIALYIKRQIYEDKEDGQAQ